MIDAELLNKGFKLVVEKKLDEANKIFDELVEANPEDISLLGMLSNVFIKTEQKEKAKDCLRKICKLNDTPEPFITLAKLEFQTDDFDNAAAFFEHAIELNENVDAIVYSLLITSFFNIKLFSKALFYAEKGLKVYPENTELMAQYITALTNAGKSLEAEKFCAEALKKHNNSSALWVSLGLLIEVNYGDDKKALECYKKALEFDEESTNAIYQMAVSYDRQNDFENAIKCYNKLLEKNPSEMAYMSLGLTYLKEKHFKEGYKNFCKRGVSKILIDWKCKNPYKFDGNLDDDILITCDQGYGDHLQFIRYIPLFKDKFKSIQLGCFKPLMKLFQETYPYLDVVDYHEMDVNRQSLKICDLPYIFDIDFDHIPYANGYFDVKPADISSDKLKVGICWEAGGVGVRGPLQRTVNPKFLEELFNMDEIQLYCLQIDDTFDVLSKNPQVINLGKDFKDFYDTAQAMKAMDIVVTVDTSVLHLAGGLGVKTLALLPYITDWRWFYDTKTTPWYTSVELFKQTEPFNWEAPIKDIICRIKELSS